MTGKRSYEYVLTERIKSGTETRVIKDIWWCANCNKAIKLGQWITSRAAGNHRNYYHSACIGVSKGLGKPS